MRKLGAALMFGVAMALPLSAMAADPISYDMPVYKDYVPHVPKVDDGLKGNFYLRGSLGGNLSWAHRVNHPNLTPDEYSVHTAGWGYSAGIGAGYETGDGLRFDVTLDYLQNHGMAADITGGNPPGDYSLNLRSKIALANVYYDFGLDGGGLSAAGGAFGYVGAGAGVAFNTSYATDPNGDDGPEGSNTSFAAAGMVGAGYDFGAIVADIGYRALYINQIANSAPVDEYSLDHATIHEIRGTLRYRFN